MKKLLVLLALISITSIVFTSCKKDEVTSINETMLVGRWVSGVDYYKFFSNNTGFTWNTSAGGTEAKATSITWSVNQKRLTISVVGGTQQGYTITEQSSNSIKFTDDAGSVYSYSKDKGAFFDEALVLGKWITGSTVYYKYLANHTGGTWDTSDDVSEAEAQKYTWSLEGDRLTQIHLISVRKVRGSAVRRNVPKVYTVTELTSSTLKYKDGFGNSTSFTKVKN